MSTLILKAKRLIDGSGKPPLNDPVVLVRSDKVAGVFQGQLPEGLSTADSEVLDFPESTLLPGLIDCHVHLNLPGDGTEFTETVSESDGVLVAASIRNASMALEAGITSLRDCGCRGTTALQARRAIELGYAQGPRIIVCGPPITITGGHCWYFGGEADGVDGVRLKAREIAKLGADFIKVMGSGGGTPNTKAWLPAFTREEISAVCDEAHRLGRKVSVHCLCADAIEYAADAGVDQIEHASFMISSDRTQVFVPSAAEKVANAGVLVTATLAVTVHPIQVLHAREGRTARQQSYLDNSMVTHEENMKLFARMLNAGVKFVAGTDAGWLYTPFGSLVDEVELMYHGGLSSMEAIVSATSRAALSLGIEQTVGTVQAGYEADIIAVRGNPLEKVSALRDVNLVMKGGHVAIVQGVRGPKTGSALGAPGERH